MKAQKAKSPQNQPAPVQQTRQWKVSDEKWSPQVTNLGHTIIPSLLLRAQARLGLNPAQLNVLMQLIEHWWQPERRPHPSKETIAARMKKSSRQVQRYLTQLENKKFIQRVERFKGRKAQTSNEYDLTGLVKKLRELEPEFSKVKEANRNRRRRAEAAKPAP